MAADVPNAAAVISQNKRYILYNPDFINGLNDKAGNEWAAISILAHEVGHHLNGHTLDNIGSRPDLELEADEFSGFVLRKLGATLKESQEAMRLAADYKGSDTHPGQQKRLTAIATGWNNAGNQSVGKDIAKNSPVTLKNKISNPPLVADKQQVVYHAPQNTHTQQSEAAALINSPEIQINHDKSVLADHNILADINFAADEKSSFYVTSLYKVVKLENNQLYVIGKMVVTDNNKLPFLITDEAGTKLWVDSQGNIINTNDQKVGFLKTHS